MFQASLIYRCRVMFFSSYLSAVCSVFPQCEGRFAAADGQQAVIWTCGLPLASGDQMSTVRDHSSHCVYLRDSPPLQPSITPALHRSLCLLRRASRPCPPTRSLFLLFLYADITCVSHLSHMFKGHIRTHPVRIQFQGVLRLTSKNSTSYFWLTWRLRPVCFADHYHNICKTMWF